MIDRARVRAALATLDRIVARWPRLRTPAAQERLADALDASERNDDSGTNDGQEDEGRGGGDARDPNRG